MIFFRHKIHPEERSILVTIALARKERLEAMAHFKDAVTSLDMARAKLMRCAELLSDQEQKEQKKRGDT